MVKTCLFSVRCPVWTRCRDTTCATDPRLSWSYRWQLTPRAAPGLSPFWERTFGALGRFLLILFTSLWWHDHSTVERAPCECVKFFFVSTEHAPCDQPRVLGQSCPLRPRLVRETQTNLQVCTSNSLCTPRLLSTASLRQSGKQTCSWEDPTSRWVAVRCELRDGVAHESPTVHYTILFQKFISLFDW